MATTQVQEQPATTEALETRGEKVKLPEVITTPEQFQVALPEWTKHFNVLSPFVAISGLAPQHGIIRTVVQMDLRANYAGESGEHGGDLYGGSPWLKGGKRGADDEALALAKGGLRKLAEGAGISLRTERVDPCTIPHYWCIRAIASYRGVDGATVTREATAEWDLRDGSERINGWTANQVKEGRKHGLRNCETRAVNAAIRECGCGLKQSYTRRELRRPFMVLRVSFQPDMSDPEQRRLVTEAGLRSTSTLYGPPALPAAARAQDVDWSEDDAQGPKPVGRGSAQPPADPPANAATTTDAPDPDEPPTEDAVRIVGIETKTGTSKKTGRPWTAYNITDSRGETHSTFDKDILAAAQQAKASGAWVEMVTETNGQYRNLVEIMPAGAQPGLPGLDNL